MLVSNLTLMLDNPADTKQPKKPDFHALMIVLLLILLAGYSLRGFLWLLTH